MNEEILKDIEKTIKEVMKEYPNPFPSDPSENWWDNKLLIVKKNDFLLTELAKKLRVKYQDKYPKEELLAMQKVYLEYPNHIPKKLLSLPWDMVKVIINLYSEEKRYFYVDLCIKESLNIDNLKELILTDFYEKVIFIMNDINNYEEVNQSDFYTKCMKIA